MYSLGATLYKSYAVKPKQTAQLEANGELSLRDLLPLAFCRRVTHSQCIDCRTDSAVHDQPELRYPNAEDSVKCYGIGCMVNFEKATNARSAQSHIEQAAPSPKSIEQNSAIKISGIPDGLLKKKKEGWAYLDRIARLNDRDLSGSLMNGCFILRSVKHPTLRGTRQLRSTSSPSCIMRKEQEGLYRTGIRTA